MFPSMLNETCQSARILSTHLLWHVFERWCEAMRSSHCLVLGFVPDVLWLLQHLVENSKAFPQLKFIFPQFQPAVVFGSVLFGQHSLIRRFVKGVHWLRPVCRHGTSWNLLHLEALWVLPFEPIKCGSLSKLSYCWHWHHALSVHTSFSLFRDISVGDICADRCPYHKHLFGFTIRRSSLAHSVLTVSSTHGELLCWFVCGSIAVCMIGCEIPPSVFRELWLPR